MDDITQQQTQARFLKLPAQLRNALADPATYDKIALVGKKFELTKVEVGLLAQSTGALMMGFLKPNEFIATIVDDLAISREKAMYIAQDLNREIFNNVKDLLKDLDNVEKKKPGVPVEPASLPARSTPAAAPPARSDWAWHGKKNEATGQIEFKHEERIPERKFTLPLTTGAGAPHVGSIFEQKLGGAFTVKTPSLPDSGQVSTVAQTGKTPPIVQAPVMSPKGTVPPGAAKAPLHVPVKPREVKIPPVQTFQPPR